MTQNLNPREKHFFAQKERERLNLKVKFIDKKSKNAPNFAKNPISNHISNHNLFPNFQTNSQINELTNELTKLDGFYNFFGANTVKNTNLEDFDNLKIQIFGEQEYCLLANFLGIKINNFYLESSIFDLENYLENL